jgi:hypothetical protein
MMQKQVRAEDGLGGDRYLKSRLSQPTRRAALAYVLPAIIILIIL